MTAPEYPEPDTEPQFVLSGPDGTLVGRGIAARYPDVAAARAALRAGDAPIVVGALPFRDSTPTALFRPRSLTRHDTLPDWPVRPLPRVRVDAEEPSAADHRRRIAAALTELRRPDPVLHKVVLARALRLSAAEPLDARSVLARLVAADPAADGYLVDLSPAGGPYLGTALVGASPELLVTRHGDRLSCRPFAGSAPRSRDADHDRDNAAALAASGKDRHEHQLVIETMRALLEPLCTELTITAAPRLGRTATLWHLSTPISGRLRDPSTTALDLAVLLHPTPAVGGVPTADAVAMISALEGDRGFYAGAVGWCDAHGDGRWMVSLRGAQLSADRRGALARSGGGIVAESDPDDELAETTTKFGAILNALEVAR
ncbi:isochorismate synthase [Mycolicibacillus trivialis]